ncbi:MAG: hypothetical protein ABIG68_02495, partial [Acidobacteriota bacterium]
MRELRVGYSYRPIPDIPTCDLSIRTALLDARHVCGDEELSRALRAQVRRHLSPLDLVLEFRNQSARVSRSASLHSVEPSLKNGAGSLRDLHRARWIYKLILDEVDDDLFDLIEARGFLPAPRIRRIQDAAEWFWQARNWLHLTTGKHTDIVINNFQDRLARELGATSAQEWLMRHYDHAETLELFREAAIRQVLAGPHDLGGVRLEGGFLRLRRDLEEPDREAPVKLFRHSQHHRIPIALEDLQQLENGRDEAAAVSDPAPEESWTFLGILREGRDVALTLRGLTRAGLIDRFIEGFSSTMRYVPPDPAHRYTVGEHSLRTVECLEDLVHKRDLSAPRFSELIAQCSHFDVLCLTALIHDAGKLLRGTDHCETGAEMAAVIGARLRLAPEKRELLELLVLHHILLVRTARLQDLKSPNVIQDVAAKIGTVEALRHLYVFTYADTRAVAENNWTSMDDRDLDELYRRVQDYLTGEGQAAEQGAAVRERLGHIRRRLARFKDPDDEAVLAHCALMPAGYVLNSSLDEIAQHVKMLKRLQQEPVVLDFYNRPGETYSELTVCTYDDPRPGMLARIAGVLYGCNTDIYKAQVFTLPAERPVVLDTLWVTSSGLQISENRARRIDAALKEVLSGEALIEEFLKRVGKQPPQGIPLDGIDLRNDLSEEHTVVHVIARD